MEVFGALQVAKMSAWPKLLYFAYACLHSPQWVILNPINARGTPMSWSTITSRHRQKVSFYWYIIMNWSMFCCAGPRTITIYMSFQENKFGRSYGNDLSLIRSACCSWTSNLNKPPWRTAWYAKCGLGIESSSPKFWGGLFNTSISLFGNKIGLQGNVSRGHFLRELSKKQRSVSFCFVRVCTSQISRIW